MVTSYLSNEELEELGFKSLGNNALISRKASIYGAENISIGNNVRIDDFCVLSGKILIGDFVHIAVYSALFGGKAGIELKDFVGVSSRCVIYAESDNYSGDTLTNPTVPEKYLAIMSEKVILNKHVLVGSGTTILPGVRIGIGSAVGCMSLVSKSLDEWGIYAGIPCKKKKDRSKNLLESEKALRKEILESILN